MRSQNSKSNIEAGANPAEPKLAATILGDCTVSLWGLTATERLKRSFVRAGVADCRSDGDPLPQSGEVVLVRADYLFEERLIRDLVARPGVILAIDRRTETGGSARVAVAAHVDAARAEQVAAALRDGPLGGQNVAGLAVLGPDEVGSAYNHALRKRSSPYVLSLTDEPRAAIEHRMFHGAYKGVTDFVTKWLWPAPALVVTRLAAKLGYSPNFITAISLFLVFAAMGLFAQGEFLAGLVSAWLMTFLDTVDGKLARVTLTSTPMGNVFDHGIDLIHPPFWYVAWWYGLVGPLGSTIDGELAAYLAPALWIIVVGYVVGRLMEGLFIWLFRIEIHAWRPIDSAFRLFTARRNPNLALLTVGTLCGRPDLGFLAVAVWTVLSLLFHGVRICQAAWLRRSGVTLQSWLSEADRRKTA
ncbi:CDP-alcohol phosphatidyltransferase family protein [Virgifigura deserti]|uniref:CDP-alcohol phosphatidyltransferase family protein n=1 Tax=Virgifigura deserti TaxID=2268457 RepID=UPI003CCBF0FA